MFWTNINFLLAQDNQHPDAAVKHIRNFYHIEDPQNIKGIIDIQIHLLSSQFSKKKKIVWKLVIVSHPRYRCRLPRDAAVSQVCCKVDQMSSRSLFSGVWCRASHADWLPRCQPRGIQENRKLHSKTYFSLCLQKPRSSEPPYLQVSLWSEKCLEWSLTFFAIFGQRDER